MLLRAAGSISLFFLFSSNTYAFSLGDHAQITRAATSGIAQCWAGSFSEASVQALIAANQWEDKNLLRKWTRYSHFYNPERTFDSVRLNSHDRMIDLEHQLRACPDESRCNELLGKALHHIQDMAAPPHVLPVNHFWTDGFEKLDIRIIPGFGFASCDLLFSEALRSTLSGIHQSTAQETWSLSQRGWIQAIRFERPRSRPMRIPLITFWVPGASGSWGEYGPFGNVFGAETLSTPLGEF